MRLPKVIKIGGYHYKVKRVKKVDADCSMGLKSNQREVILIEEGHGKEEEQILLHEILHAIDDTYNNEKLPEDMIERLSQGLWDFLRNNKIEWRK